MKLKNNLVHENLGNAIAIETNPVRRKVVRQDRIDVDDHGCHMEFGPNRLIVRNYSSFGIGGVPEGWSTEVDKEYTDVAFVFENMEISRLHVRCVRVQQEGDTTSAAFEIMGEPLNIQAINAVKIANRLVLTQMGPTVSAPGIPEKVRLLTYEIKSWLERLQSHVSQIAVESVGDIQSRLVFESAFTDVIAQQVRDVLQPHVGLLHDELKLVSPETLGQCVQFIRDEIKSLIYQSPFADRTFAKPLGYAGDFEMMNFIYRNQPEGQTLFGKCLHRFNMGEPAAQAVRNRASYVLNKIKSTIARKQNSANEVKILSVACGPAREIQKLVREVDLSEKIQIDLLDQDTEALKFAQRQIGASNPKARSRIRYIDRAIKHIIVNGLEDSHYDLIYSAGLFDYLSDPVAQAAAHKLFTALAPGGQLVIGNFSIANPNIPFMELVFDWHLIYRTEEQMTRLFSGIAKDLTVEKEDLGVNLFCCLPKPIT